jgi:hypothetical protein
MGLGQPAEPAGAADEGDGGKPPARGAKTSQDIRDKILDKVIDKVLDGKLGGSGEDSPQIKALTTQVEQANRTIQQMREDREQERFDRIEANIAALASRDPWEDPRGIEVMRQRLGIPNTLVTDSSPAVQLLKDSADKVDKNVGRLVGIVERIALKSEEFRPEETRSPSEREKKAEEILTDANKRQKSIDIRKRAFEL